MQRVWRGKGRKPREKEQEKREMMGRGYVTSPPERRQILIYCVCRLGSLGEERGGDSASNASGGGCWCEVGG